MTAKYARDGISFQFPENWKLEEDPPQGIPRTISVTAENGAFWSASLYDKGQPLDELKQQFVDAIEEEYEEVEIDDLELELGEQSTHATDFQFYCLDFLVHSRLLVAVSGDYNLLIAWQAEDRDFDQVEPVFSAITYSLLQGKKSAQPHA